jgi:hypothetical protein
MMARRIERATSRGKEPDVCALRFAHLVGTILAERWVITRDIFTTAESHEATPEENEVRRAQAIRNPDEASHKLIAAPPPFRLVDRLIDATDMNPYVPTPQQRAILLALDGRALRQDQLEAVTGYDRRQLHRESGLTGLRRRDKVRHNRRLGYFRPDSPPPELRKAA